MGRVDTLIFVLIVLSIVCLLIIPCGVQIERVAMASRQRALARWIAERQRWTGGC